jgi:hypothetical protein
VAQAKGIINVRHALVQDACYEWRAEKPRQPANWQYALEFNNGRLWATVLFDFEQRQVALAGGKRTATLDPAISENWRQFFEEQQFAELQVEDAPPADAKPEPEKAVNDEQAAGASNAGRPIA